MIASGSINARRVLTLSAMSLLAILGAAESLCAATCVAIPMDYHVVKSRSKYMVLAGWSESITYNTHSYADYPNINWSTRYKPYRLGNGEAAITSWNIVSAPTHGTLYEGMAAALVGYAVRDPDNLLYVPQAGYTGNDSFAFQVTDASGTSSPAVVSIHVEDASSYTMPVGIPDPGFGLADEPPADPPEWPNSVAAGYYYLDNSGVCSDSSPYGYPLSPRCTIPTVPIVGAGKKMVVKASPLPYHTRSSNWHQFQLNGAPGQRAWLVGVNNGPNKPVIKADPTKPNTIIRMEGSYWTIDGIVFDDAIPTVRADLGAESYVVIRHSEMMNQDSTVGSATSMNVSTQNGLYFDNHIHDNGKIEENLSAEHDVHGIQVSAVKNLWILDNVFHENAGDAVQVNGVAANNIYIGRNKMHSEGENAIDTKSFNVLIASENDGWDMRLVTYGNSGGQSQVFYINDEGTQVGGWWAINNRAWDSGGPGVASAAMTTDVHLVGNVVVWCKDGIVNYIHGGHTTYIYNNTIDHCRNSALNVSVTGGPGGFTRFSGNYIGTGTWVYHVVAVGALTTDTGSFKEFDFNYFAEPAKLLWANTLRDLSWMRANTAWLANAAEGVVPDFVGADSFQYSLKTGSPLINKNTNVFSSYGLFSAAFSRNIESDRNSVSRPHGIAWDIGAYEHAAGPTPPHGLKTQ